MAAILLRSSLRLNPQPCCRLLHHAAVGQPIQLGDSEMVMGQNMQRLNIHNEFLASPKQLNEHLQRDGYLYIKGFHPRQAVREPCDPAVSCATYSF
jgi:hypothetical protein